MRNIEYIIIVYNNRTESLRLHGALTSLGVRNSVVPTPNQVSASCGLSIKLRYVDINKLLFCINKNNLSQRYTMFLEKKGYNQTIYQRLN